MEDKTTETPPYRIYIEYSLLNSSNDEGEELFCFHLNFNDNQYAERIYNVMKQRWKLPVEIHQNRIVVLPAKDANSPGTHKYIDKSNAHGDGGYIVRYVGIRFKYDEHNYEFDRLIIPPSGAGFNGMKNSTTIINDHNFYFKKSELFRDEYSYDDRVTQLNGFVKKYSFIILSLRSEEFTNKTKFPIDIIKVILEKFIPFLNPDKNTNLMRLMKLDNIFSLSTQQVTAPKRKDKTNFTIEYVDEKREFFGYAQYSIYLTAPTAESAMALYRKFREQWNIGVELDYNRIKIKPGVSTRQGTVEGVFFSKVRSSDKMTLSISFEERHNMV